MEAMVIVGPTSRRGAGPLGVEAVGEDERYARARRARCARWAGYVKSGAAPKTRPRPYLHPGRRLSVERYVGCAFHGALGWPWSRRCRRVGRVSGETDSRRPVSGAVSRRTSTDPRTLRVQPLGVARAVVLSAVPRAGSQLDGGKEMLDRGARHDLSGHALVQALQATSTFAPESFRW